MTTQSMTTQSMTTQSSKLDYFEGLRGIAALVVVINHLKQTFWCDFELDLAKQFSHLNGLPGTVFGLARNLLFACFDGNFSVWLFWVMSAYVLSIQFYRTTGEAAYRKLANASLRRYPRLALPVLVSVILAWGLHASGLITNTKLAEQLGQVYGRDVATFYLFKPDLVQALHSALWQSFFAYEWSSSYNRVLWTMEIELWGSFFLFATLALFGKHRARYLIIGIMSIVLMNLRAYWLIAFLSGLILCDLTWHRNSAHSESGSHHPLQGPFANRCRAISTSWWANGTLFMLIMILIGCPNYFDSFHLLLATVVTLFALLSPKAQTVLRAPAFMFLGKISFGMYLVHLPILCAAAYPFYSKFSRYVDSSIAAVATSLVIIGLSVLGGWLLWFFVDKHAVFLARMIAAKLDGVTPKPHPQENPFAVAQVEGFQEEVLQEFAKRAA